MSDCESLVQRRCLLCGYETDERKELGALEL